MKSKLSHRHKVIASISHFPAENFQTPIMKRHKYENNNKNEQCMGMKEVLSQISSSYSKLLMNFRKPRPWKSVKNKSRRFSNKKAFIKKIMDDLARHRFEPKKNIISKSSSIIAEPKNVYNRPFTMRTVRNSIGKWDLYVEKLNQWLSKHNEQQQQQQQQRKSMDIESSEQDRSRLLHTLFQLGNMYRTKQCKTRDEMTRALRRMCTSNSIEQSMRTPGKQLGRLFANGRPSPVVDPQTLSHKTRMCLNSLVRVVDYNQEWMPDSHSGDENEGIHVWNRSIHN